VSEAPLFAFQSVSVGPPDAPRLDGLDADLPDGGLTVIAGPSGSGKSTLLRLCNRLEVPSAGTVRHRGTDVELRREVAMVLAVDTDVERQSNDSGSARGRRRVAQGRGSRGGTPARARIQR
jgi:putative ABC transport system ATP-binding protein